MYTYYILSNVINYGVLVVFDNIPQFPAIEKQK